MFHGARGEAPGARMNDFAIPPLDQYRALSTPGEVDGDGEADGTAA
jgi:hypothetical protein